MVKNEGFYQDLLRRYINGGCSVAELEEVMDYLAKDASNRALLAALQQEFDVSPNHNMVISEEQSERLRKEILQQISPARVISLKKKRWLYMAAACAIFVLAISGYFLWPSKPAANKNTTCKNGGVKDLPAGTNKAILTLGNDSTIILDDAGNGALAQQGSTRLTKLDGKLAYDAGRGNHSEILYNTITTPRGGEYQVQLPDGTQVWLNAASTLRFPTAFTGKERKVSITGEAYFEVAHNTAMPFIVSVNQAEVRVLGTHFNVMAYNDEDAIKTTLLKGSVRFKNGKDSSLLEPGQQSQLTRNGKLSIDKDVNTDKALAWKTGVFDFEEDDIYTITRQFARWYNIDVQITGNFSTETYSGIISRNLSLMQVLQILKIAGVNYELKEKTLLITKS